MRCDGQWSNGTSQQAPDDLPLSTDSNGLPPKARSRSSGTFHSNRDCIMTDGSRCLSLPPELIHAIMRYITSFDRFLDSLCNDCLVDKIWRASAQAFLFE